MKNSNQRHIQTSDAPVSATITVQVTDEVTNWEVECADNSATLQAICVRPEWCPLDWEVPADMQSAHDPRAYSLLLQKMRFVLDFASPGGIEADLTELDRRIAQVRGSAKGRITSDSSEVLPIHVEGRLMPHGEMAVNMYYDRKGSIVGSSDSESIQQFAADSLRRELRLPSENLQMRRKSGDS